MKFNSLTRLTRDARDALFLLAAIAAIALPHAQHLPLWATAIVLLVLAWRGALAWRGHPLPGRLVLALVLAACIALTWITYKGLVSREPGITMVVLLLALKTLELRARRDAFVVFFLGFFLVLTHFLYSQSLLTALWMLAAVWALLTSVVLAQMPVGQPSLALAARHAARTTALGLPVMLLLFFLFPRIAPLWGIPAENIGRTGLSNQLDFGGMSEIANDDSVALRLRFQGPPPPLKALYFRGPVLSRFDGRTWRPGEDSAAPQAGNFDVTGPPLRYEMTMEPLRIRVLPLLEMSPEPVGTTMLVDALPLRREADLRWAAGQPITERLRLQAQAYPSYRAGMQESQALRLLNLQLPRNLNPRTREWAAALARQPRFASMAAQERPQALAEAVMQHIASADFTYTLSPGRYGETAPDVIDEFWFDRRLGFCEHFAAAFVVVMRNMGVPARVVTGFQGMDAVEQDGYRVVRNSNAHAWAEYWVAGRGWLRADPTAAVAPERVDLGRALRPAPGALEQLSPALWANVRQGWETLNNRWQQLVLNYSRQNQFDLMKQLGFAQPDWTALGQVIAAFIALLTAAGGAWTLWQARPHDAWSRQRAQALRELDALGVPAAAHQSPSRWAALLADRFGPAASPASALLLSLEHARYARTAAEPGWRERRRWLKAFRAAGRMLRRPSPQNP